MKRDKTRISMKDCPIANLIFIMTNPKPTKEKKRKGRGKKKKKNMILCGQEDCHRLSEFPLDN